MMGANNVVGQTYKGWEQTDGVSHCWQPTTRNSPAGWDGTGNTAEAALHLLSTPETTNRHILMTKSGENWGTADIVVFTMPQQLAIKKS